MKTKIVIIAGILMAGMLPASAQNATTQPGGSATVSTGDGVFPPMAKGSFNINAAIGYTSTGTSTTNNLTSNSSHFDSIAVPNTKASTFSITLYPAYMVADNFQVGVLIDYLSTVNPMSVSGYDNGNVTYFNWNDKIVQTQFGLAATKFLRIAHNFYFTCSLDVTYNTFKVSNSELVYAGFLPNEELVTLPDETSSGIGVDLDPGLEYFPSHHWGINFAFADVLAYSSSSIDNTDPQYNNGTLAYSTDEKTNSFTIGAGVRPTLGVRYYFGRGGSN